jgi:hypothetical protein
VEATIEKVSIIVSKDIITVGEFYAMAGGGQIIFT